MHEPNIGGTGSQVEMLVLEPHHVGAKPKSQTSIMMSYIVVRQSVVRLVENAWQIVQ